MSRKGKKRLRVKTKTRRLRIDTNGMSKDQLIQHITAIVSECETSQEVIERLADQLDVTVNSIMNHRPTRPEGPAAAMKVARSMGLPRKDGKIVNLMVQTKHHGRFNL